MIFRADYIDKLSKEMIGLAKFIGENPELAFNEHQSKAKLTQFLERHGFLVRHGTGSLNTAFVATMSHGKGPNIGFLAEYDALPGIGHGCGHNLIGVASCGAGVALGRELKSVYGTVTVVGCPAEEGGGGKVLLAKKGVFKNLTVAMMAHPDSRTEVIKYMLALHELDIYFHGRAAHAASEPEKGINALQAAVNTFQNIAQFTKTLSKDARVNGIFTEAGLKPNIIPEKATLKYYIRSLEMKNVNKILKRVKSIAEREAKKIGAKVTYWQNPIAYEPFHPSHKLAKIFAEQLKYLNVKNDQGDPKSRIGSSDIGNVGQIVPAIHPSIKICDDHACHTKAFAEAALTNRGYAAMLNAAKALAMTGHELLSNPNEVKKIQDEFKKKKIKKNYIDEASA